MSNVTSLIYGLQQRNSQVILLLDLFFYYTVTGLNDTVIINLNSWYATWCRKMRRQRRGILCTTGTKGQSLCLPLIWNREFCWVSMKYGRDLRSQQNTTNLMWNVKPMWKRKIPRRRLKIWSGIQRPKKKSQKVNRGKRWPIDRHP